MDDQELALARLHMLAAIPDELKIITAEVRSELRMDPDDPRSPASPGVDLRRPDSFVLSSVVEIEAPDGRGRVRALSAPFVTPDGRTTRDWTQGQPVDLLRRLTEWRG